MDREIQELQSEIALLKKRNARVELEKRWETSLTRKLSICILTYGVMCLVMLSIGVKDFYASAIVPTLGFFLSTLSLPFIKRYWVSRKD